MDEMRQAAKELCEGKGELTDIYWENMVKKNMDNIWKWNQQLKEY